MNFALLGDDPACLPLVAALAASGEHHLSLAAHVGTLAAPLRKRAPQLRLADHWQDVLSDAACDPVIVCGAAPEVLLGARRLAVAGRRLVLFPRADQQSTLAYDLAPLDDAGDVVHVPIFPGRYQAALREVLDRRRSGVLNSIHLIQLERTWPAAEGAAGASLIPHDEIERRLLEDIDLLRQLGGDYHQVTAWHTGAVSQGAAAATVMLTGQGLPEAAWSFRLGRSPTARLTLIGERGTEVVDSPASIGNEDEEEREAGRRMLGDIEQVLSHPASPAWTDCVHAFDLLDASRRSLRRRRTIELHFGSLSERSQFKTQMTAAGCGILGFTLCGAILLLTLGAVLDPRDAEQRRSEAAGFVFHAADFAPAAAARAVEGRTSPLTDEALERTRSTAAAMRLNSAAVIVEAAVGDEAAAVDAHREEAVVQALVTAGVPRREVEARVSTRPLAGSGFRLGLTIAWVIVFLPLFGFLLLQALIVLAREERPGRRRAG